MTKQPVMGDCRLCMKTAPLQRSHVVPEYFYKDHYDEKGRMMKLVRSTAKLEIEQKGLRERLLCAECERFLNDNFEKPYHQFWRECKELRGPVRTSPLVLRGFDYATFKLLHLSILWRFMITKSVGEVTSGWEARLRNNADMLRQTIINRDAGESRFNSIVAIAVVDPRSGERLQGVVLPPTIGEIDGYSLACSMYDGFGWLIYLAPHSLPTIKKYALKSHGEIRCPVSSFAQFKPIIEGVRSMPAEVIRKANAFAARSSS